MIGIGTHIGSVTLRVENLHRCERFYQNVIGLQVHNKTSERIFMGTQSSVLLILNELKDGTSSGHSNGLYHMAFRVPSRSDLGHWLNHIYTHRLTALQGASDHSVSEALYLSDPEGNGIEMYCDRPPSTWKRLQNGHIELVTLPLDLPSLIEEASDQEWQQLPEGSDMGHVHFRVNDLAAARRFYVDLLGFQIQSEFRNSALFVAAGSYHHHFGLNTWESLGAPNRSDEAYGLENVRVVTDGIDDLKHLRKRLESANYPFKQPDGEHIFVADPSNNRLQITTQHS